MFYLPAHGLCHNFAAIPARLAAVELRVAANMGTDGTGRDAQHQRDFGGVLALLEHLVDNFDVLFFRGYTLLPSELPGDKVAPVGATLPD